MNFLKTVSCKLSEIDFSDRSFPFSFGELPQKLLASVGHVGILQPPVLLESAAGHKIVCGRRRLESLKRSRTQDIEIEILAAAGNHDRKLFRRALWENLAQREFNPVEIADIYVRALELFSSDEVLTEIQPALKIPQKERFYRRYQAIAGFSKELRELLAAGVIDSESVDLMREWDAAEHQALIDLITETGLRRNKLREVIGRLDDLARRDGVSPCQPLASACAVIRDDAGKLAIADLRAQLKAQLYPNLTAARCDFAGKLARLSLPADIRLDSPPDFEGGEFKLCFNFSDSRQWQASCRKLNAIALEDIDELCSRT